MDNKKIILNIRQCDRAIFDAILDGSKKVETRAASTKFQNLKTGDIAVLKCGREKAERRIKTVRYVAGIDELLKYYIVSDINPSIKEREELEKMYYSWPNYREKIEKFGLVAIEFEG